MKQPDNNHPTTPSEFYKNRRPENFSDSEKTYVVELPKETFAHELSMTSTNMKQDAFETFCRRLSEKFISPNLIPQVGPTGGGDGKTDSETYPVSEIVSDRWFTPENSWNRDENWAFAFSAKKDWKTKVKGDVKKIVDTKRGYTRVYFISNQHIPSKDKKATQDELKAIHKIDIVILDGEWIIEKVYSNDLISLAVDSLNLSPVYKNEKITVGANDAARTKRLKEVEEAISNPNRYFEYDHQLVEDALEAAILTRMLERPKDEIIGKFERALRFGKKVNSSKQLLRIHYQMAWTYINWFDDYTDFVASFKAFKEFAEQDISIFTLEEYFTLLQLLRTISLNGKTKPLIGDIDYAKEEESFKQILDQGMADRDKPSTALVAGTYKAFLNLFRLLTGRQDVAAELRFLRTQLEASRFYLEFPFEGIRRVIEIFGEILPDSREYDDLIDCIADISEGRASELASARTFLKRGIQKLDKKFYRESLIYFGKSIRKLAKEESQDYLYIAIRGLGQAYEHLGLHWAANNCLLAAASITFRDWSNEGRPSQRFFNSVKDAMSNELFIGRIPYFLGWHELFAIVAPQFEVEEPENEDIKPDLLADACLSVRLLNTSDKLWKAFGSLPDIFAQQGLTLSEDAALYLLGHVSLVETSQLKDGRTIDDYFNKMADQPFKQQMVSETELLNEEFTTFHSVILGTKVNVRFKRNKELCILAELVLAFLESFLATSFDSAFPSAETITITLDEDAAVECFESIESDDSSSLTLKVNLSLDANKGYWNDIHKLLTTLIAQLLPKNFHIHDAENFLRNLFEKDEVHERQSLIIEHRKFIINVFGNDPKIFLADWIKNSAKTYDYIRTDNPIKAAGKTNAKEDAKTVNLQDDNDIKAKFDNVKHNETTVASVIDTHLWQQARWKGFGFFSSPDIPLGIFLAFEDGIAGHKIFQNWLSKFGRIDKDDTIMVTIVRGINKQHPHWYRVQISKTFSPDDRSNGRLFVYASRSHEMNPESGKNLANMLTGFERFQQYALLPATYKPDGTIDIMPYLKMGILKRKLVVRDAWAIGENDLDSVVIRSYDDPIIPADQPDAPVISLLAKMRRK